MSTAGKPNRAEAVERILHALLETFDSYHSNIREQTALVDALIGAVEKEERRRCLAIAQRAADAASSDGARHTAEAIAGEIRET